MHKGDRMATSKEFRDFVLDQLRLVDGITCKPMMGEYLLYRNGKLFGGIYDARLLVKKTPTNKAYNLPEEIPYDSAKPMYMIEDIDDAQTVRDIVLATVGGE